REIIQDGIDSQELVLDTLSLDSFKRSQQGSFNHRQFALPFRLALMKRQGRKMPPKRFKTGRIHLDFKIVQVLRRFVRARSLVMWRKEPIAEVFNRRMALSLRLLRFATRANGRMKGLRRRLKGGVIK